MKRILDRSNAGFSAKRTRSSQACSSCRKSKTRCEQPDGVAYVSGFARCHRCRVLNMQCSFENSDNLPRPLRLSIAHPGALAPVQSCQTHSTPITLPEIFAQHTNAIPEDESVGRLRINSADWNPTPLLTLQELSGHPKPAEDATDEEFRTRLTRLLSPEQIVYLLQIFDLRYSCWLGLPRKPEVRSPFLDLARCTVASRALDPATRSLVAPQLTKATEEAVLKHIFHPSPSTESIKALLILSIWSPLSCSSHGAVRDGRLLAASAIRMALDLRLSEASALVIRLHARSKRENGLSDGLRLELDDAVAKARLWISLTVVESILYIGTGRASLTHRSVADNSVIDIQSPAAITNEQDVRIDCAVWIQELSKRAVNVRLAGVSDFDRWHGEILEIMAKLDSIHSLISQTPQEKSIGLPLHYCVYRLLVLYHAIREVRNVFRNAVPEKPWYTQVTHNGVNVATDLGKEALVSAEGVLISVISGTDLSFVRSAPDSIFVFISFAAVFLTTIYCENFQGSEIHFSHDKLLRMTIERLTQAAYTTDHAPAKCARLISASLENRKMPFSKSNSPSGRNESLGIKNEAAGEPSPDAAMGPSSPSPQQPNDILPWFGDEFDGYKGPETFVDFWASFMHNLSADPKCCGM